jgi:PKD repeat protein
MFKKWILLSLFGLSIGFVNAQNQTTPYIYQNADGELLQKKVAENPSIIGKYVMYEENFKKLINASANAKSDTLIDGKRIIPVVFHIIHNGGPENISREQVEDAVARLNIDYNKLNSDTTAAYSWPAFTGRRANCAIEFRLAKIDPQGNCTDGIIHHMDPQTNYAYFGTMSQYAWPPSKYMNIFSVAYIYPEGITLPEGAFIGGMSPFPPSNALSQALTGGDTLADGVLIRHDGLGSIGTATNLGGMPINALNRTFTHETGHYFNLYHPFQNLMFGLIPASSGCPSMFATTGDEVDDTPPVDVASQNTSLSCYVPGDRNTCNQDSPDEPDMVENYMDYQWGYCTNIFTTGQYARIDATMNGDRRKLWSKENLMATGVLDTNASVCAPIADFNANTTSVCPGGSVTFTDFSFNGLAASWSWTFPGGTPATSIDQNPVVVYNVPGTYEAKLLVTNAYGMDSLIKTAYIHVSDPALTTTAPVLEDFEIANINDWSVQNDIGNAWSLNTAAHYSGSKCIALENFSGNNAGSYDMIISPSYDLTSLPTDNLPVVKFKLAYSGKYVAGTITTAADTVYDKLLMYASYDCGASWTQKYNKSGINLATVTTLNDDFAPSATTDWREESVSLPSAFLTKTNVRLKFVFYSNGGNNVYIDDINITSPSLAAVETGNMLENLSIEPNPMDDASVINFNLISASQVQISVLDITGKKVFDVTDARMNQGSHSIQLSENSFNAPGMYFVNVSVNGISNVLKLIVK